MNKQRLSQYEKGFICCLVAKNQTYVSIQDSFREQFNRKISTSTISRLRYPQNRELKIKGRKRMFNEAKEKVIIRLVDKNRLKTWKEISEIIARKTNLNVSWTLLRTISKRNGIRSYIKKKKPFLTDVIVKQRLEFCRNYKHKTLRFWRRVMFVDESSFALIDNKSRIGEMYVKCKKNERLLKGNVLRQKKFNFPVIKYWCCMNYNGIGSLRLVNRKMNSVDYQEILSSTYLESIRNLGVLSPILLSDNETTHGSASTVRYMQRNDIEFIKIPSNSPDLNCLENLLSIWKKNVYKNRIKNVEDLKYFCNREWFHIDSTITKSLVTSMKDRLLKIEKNRGWYSKY